MTAQDDDQATQEDIARRMALTVKAYLTRRERINGLADEIRTLRLTLRQLVAELEPRMNHLDARFKILARTAAELLAEVDHDHTTTVVRLQGERARTSVETGPPEGLGPQVADPRAPTPRDGTKGPI
jgi:hypothetical protein